MKYGWWLILVCVSLCNPAMNSLCAEEPPPLAEESQKPKVDPTQASPRLQQQLKPPDQPVAAKVLPAMIEVEVKAIILAPNQTPTAVLQIKETGSTTNGTRFTAREGAHYNVTDTKGAVREIIVRRITAEGIEYEIPDLKLVVSKN